MKRSLILQGITILTLFVFSNTSANAGNLYWVGGQGNWTNTAKWSTTSGGAPSTVLPDANTNVIFDINSGLSAGDNVNIPGGDHFVEDFIVTGFAANFRIRFIGGTGDPTIMNVHGDLRLLNTHSTVYFGTELHKWIFHGKAVGSQEIKSAGRNLHYVVFPNDNKEYHLTSNLSVSDRIDYDGGDLTTNNFTMSTSRFSVDNNGPAATSQKEFNAGTSVINCGVFYSKFTYGALNITGKPTFVVDQFQGGPTQVSSQDTSFYHRIVLNDYEPGSTITDNNFECYDCVIDTLIINNNFDTQLHGAFTIQYSLEIINSGAHVFFNGGNAQPSEVTINGQVVTPSVSGCADRVSFESTFTDFAIFIRESGTLTVSDINLKNIQTQGNATFEASNAILLESSTGWSQVNSPTPKIYHWKGNSGTDIDWDNPNNWRLSNGVLNGCLPTSVDDVIVNDGATNGIRIPPSYSAACHNFIWSKTSPTTLIFEAGASQAETVLRVTGNLFFHSSAVVQTSSFYEMILDATSNNYIETNGISLPTLTFIGFGGQWKISDDLDCNGIYLKSGTLITQNNDIVTNYFVLTDSYPKGLTLGSSHIIVNGKLDLEPYDQITITINPGTSLIECEEFEYRDVTLYDIQLNNSSSETLSTYSNLTANRFILNGTGELTGEYDITVNSLVIKPGAGAFNLDPTMTLEVEDAILSEATSANPATVKSSVPGTQSQIQKLQGNLCVAGYINFQDIEADLPGTFHTPMGTDGGNNTNIDFSNSSILTPLYWIGNTGSWNVNSNWSNLSGGCPVNKNPNTANKLVFDDRSFESSTDTIHIPLLTNCKTMAFDNTVFPANFDVQTRLNPLQVIINGAEVHFTGHKMYVQVKTVVNEDSYLVLDVTEGSDPKYDTPILELYSNSNVLTKSNTLLKVRQ